MTSSPELDALESRLRSLIAGGEPRRLVGRDPVNQPMIRHWCDAIGESDPIYLDREAAGAAGFGDVVAPPAALQVWIMPGLRAPEPAPDDAASQVVALLEEAGFTSVVATNCEQDYDRYLEVGDEIVAEQAVESISGLKQTALGAGYFLTTRTDFRDRSGSRVGSMRFRTLRFRPATDGGGEDA